MVDVPRCECFRCEIGFSDLPEECPKCGHGIVDFSIWGWSAHLSLIADRCDDIAGGIADEDANEARSLAEHIATLAKMLNSLIQHQLPTVERWVR